MRKLKLDELNRLSTEEFKNAEKLPVIVVLDNIRSAANIGSVFRTCDAFLIEAIYLIGICATPPNRDIQKSALGATETVDWKHFETIKTIGNNLTNFSMVEKIGGPLFPLFAKMIPPFDKAFEQFAKDLKKEAETITKTN